MNLYVYSLPTMLVILLWMLVALAVWCLSQRKRLPMNLLHKLLRKLDMVKKGPEDSDEKPQSTLHGQKVPVASVYMFLAFLSSAGALISMAFINTLLVQRTVSCNPKVDCFLYNITAAFDFSKQDVFTTLVNCNNLTDDSVFICYKFQFDLTYALAVAGGLITIAKLTINITTSVLSWLMNRQTEKGKKIVTLIIIISLFMCLFLLIIITFIFRKFISELIVVLSTDGFIFFLQLLLFFFGVGAATSAVAGVHCSNYVKELTKERK